MGIVKRILTSSDIDAALEFEATQLRREFARVNLIGIAQAGIPLLVDLSRQHLNVATMGTITAVGGKVVESSALTRVDIHYPTVIVDTILDTRRTYLAVKTRLGELWDNQMQERVRWFFLIGRPDNWHDRTIRYGHFLPHNNGVGWLAGYGMDDFDGGLRDARGVYEVTGKADSHEASLRSPGLST